MALELITAPTVEPLTRAEVKQYLRIDEGSGADVETTLALDEYDIVTDGTTVDITGGDATVALNIGAVEAATLATVIVEQSDDDSTWETAATFTTIQQANQNTNQTYHYTGSCRYLRASISAISGGSVTFAGLVFLEARATEDDQRVDALITATRQIGENYLKRAFCTQVWDWTQSAFPCWEAYLPQPPLQSLTIGYINASGSTATVSTIDYIYSTPRYRRSRVEPRPNGYWPTAQDRDEAVTYHLTAGYGGASDVPTALKQGMLLLIRNLYDNAQSYGSDRIIKDALTLPLAVRALWDTERWSI